MVMMRRIGTIERLQVQTGTLKRGPKRAIYDPVNLVEVERLRLEPAGGFGLLPDGSEIMDAHHKQHPYTQAKRKKGSGFSLNFVTYYEAMWRQFAGEVPLGCGGENLLIRTLPAVDLAEVLDVVVAKGLVLVGETGQGAVDGGGHYDALPAVFVLCAWGGGTGRFAPTNHHQGNIAIFDRATWLVRGVCG